MVRERDKPGSLFSKSLTKGRKIDQWVFRCDMEGKSILANTLEFDVSVLPDFSFKVETSDIPKERFSSLVGTDLTVLHKLALDAAREDFLLRENLVWSDWLDIRVRTMPSHERRDILSGSLVSISYSKIPRAERPDGSAFTVSRNILVSFPSSVGVLPPSDSTFSGRQHTDPKYQAAIDAAPPNSSRLLNAQLNANDQRDPTTQFTYMPDTPENRAGLDALIAALDGINARLQEFLSPEKIQDTLVRALSSGQRLLSSPSNEVDPAEQEGVIRRPKP